MITPLKNKGLYGKYFIEKVSFSRDGTPNGTLPVEDDAEYFVLRLDEAGSDKEHIKACRIAVNAYADAIKHHLPELAKDLKERYPI